MALPDSYVVNYGSVPNYFNAILDAHPPERFSYKFLENLGFTSTNDRQFIGVLKDLGFLDDNAVPQQRYYDFLDRSNSSVVLADAIREAFSDLFAINKNAQDLSAEDVKNKLRTLYAGKKTDLVIGRIAKTFEALCAEADFSRTSTAVTPPTESKTESPDKPRVSPPHETPASPPGRPAMGTPRLELQSLQYHINIVLPESRDQAVYDAIFKSMREHLG
jgi:hypothetical protein